MLDSNFHDPEGLLFCARNFIHVGEVDRGLGVLEATVAHGLFCDRLLETDPWLDPVRGNERFDAVLETARTRSLDAEAAYEEAGGVPLLGPGLRARGTGGTGAR